MRLALLADFGSTFTKVVAVDLVSGSLVGLGQSMTTADTDVLDGYEAAVRGALSEVAGVKSVAVEFAASSAGGGLRMAAVGLMADFTGKAAEMAALNAGARVEAVLVGSVDERGVAVLERVRPEIVLFAGGTDGGERRRVLENAALISKINFQSIFVVACNAQIANEVRSLFDNAGHHAVVVANVMPELGVTNIDPARAAINRYFLSHVIHGKHLSTSPRFEELVVMATPEAVLNATALLAEINDSKRVGDGVIVSDVGGATTDFYSALVRRPVNRADTGNKGLIAPLIARTVQGDLGIRFNARSILDADREWLEKQFGDAPRLQQACDERSRVPSVVFEDGWERLLDEGLAVACMTNGLRRHCGRRHIRTGVKGKLRSVQSSPDLRSVGTFVAGGGILRESTAAEELATQALRRQGDDVLAPRRCRIVVDRHYILAAAGLLAQKNRAVAAHLLNSELRLERK